MANKVQMPENDLMVETKGKLELFFDKYGNKVLWALVGVTVVAVLAFAWYSYSSRNNEAKEAAAEIARVNVLGGAEEYAAVVTEFKGTKSANLSAVMAAAAYLEAGDLTSAKEYIALYEDCEGGIGEIINGMVYTLKGDIAVEENDLQSAVVEYQKALEASDDEYTYTTALRKLALVYEAMGNGEKAQELYKAALVKYPANAQSYTKYIKE